MKLDRRQPFGEIYGHPCAKYEQGGLSFDCEGNEICTDIAPVSKPKPAEPDLANAVAFLKVILAGGPVDKAAVYKEAESNNQNWSEVTTAFAKLRGVAFKRGQTQVWRLNSEETV